MKRGFIKLYRKTLDSSVFSDPLLFHLFSFCLLKANHKSSYVSIDGVNKPIKIEPGQFITGRHSFHSKYYSLQKRKVCKFAPLTIWKKLKVLEDMQILNIRSNNKFSIITVVNWNTYQNVQLEKEQQNKQQLSNSRTSTEHQLNTSKEYKKNNKEYNKKNVKPDSESKKSESGLTLQETRTFKKESDTLKKKIHATGVT